MSTGAYSIRTASLKKTEMASRRADGLKIEAFYGLSYTAVSLLFLVPLPAYVLASLVNHRLHSRLGQRGIALLGPGCHVAAFAVNSAHPRSYAVLVASFAVTSFGNGLVDSGWNAWIGNLASANELLGFLHGFYGAGAVLSPLIATALVAEARLGWFSFYYLMVGHAGRQH